MELEAVIKELDARIGKMSESLAVMNSNVSRQGEVIDKLVSNFERLTIFIEKTNENNKKIDVLFKKYDFVYEKGTKNCLVHKEKMNNLEDDIATINNRIDNLQKILLGVGIGVAMQFLGLLVYLIKMHIM